MTVDSEAAQPLLLVSLEVCCCEGSCVPSENWLCVFADCGALSAVTFAVPPFAWEDSVAGADVDMLSEP